jgi:threonine/homoserine/homoserine lactone efflux protein
MTNGQARWVVGGMCVGAICWIAAGAAGYRYALLEPNPLMALTVIGGLLGWIAAKIFRNG